MHRGLSDRQALFQMGYHSRRLAEEVFDVRLVNDTILRAMKLRAGAPRPVQSAPLVPAPSLS